MAHQPLQAYCVTPIVNHIPKHPQILCPICERSVPLETAKTDEHGNAIHEDCYVLKLQLKLLTDC